MFFLNDYNSDIVSQLSNKTPQQNYNEQRKQIINQYRKQEELKQNRENLENLVKKSVEEVLSGLIVSGKSSIDINL